MRRASWRSEAESGYGGMPCASRNWALCVVKTAELLDVEASEPSLIDGAEFASDRYEAQPELEAAGRLAVLSTQID